MCYSNIYLILNSLTLRCDGTNNMFTVFDGHSTSGPILGEFCDSTVPVSYLVSSGKYLTLTLRTGSTNLMGHISFSYFSDSTRSGCGYEVSRPPGLYTASTMILTEGSLSSDGMRAGMDCEWVIRPEVTSVTNVNYDEGDPAVEREVVKGGKLAQPHMSTAHTTHHTPHTTHHTPHKH